MAKHLEAIAPGALVHVTGGLITPRQGPDPAVVKDVSDLANAAGALMQAKQQGQQASAQMTQGLFQSLAQRRQGGA